MVKTKGKDGFSRTGNTIAQPPINIPKAQSGKVIIADSESIYRTKNKKQLRKYARQKITALTRRGMEVPKKLIEIATRPQKKARR